MRPMLGVLAITIGFVVAWPLRYRYLDVHGQLMRVNRWTGTTCVFAPQGYEGADGRLMYGYWNGHAWVYSGWNTCFDSGAGFRGVHLSEGSLMPQQ